MLMFIFFFLVAIPKQIAVLCSWFVQFHLFSTPWTRHFSLYKWSFFQRHHDKQSSWGPTASCVHSLPPPTKEGDKLSPAGAWNLKTNCHPMELPLLVASPGSRPYKPHRARTARWSLSLQFTHTHTPVSRPTPHPGRGTRGLVLSSFVAVVNGPTLR